MNSFSKNILDQMKLDKAVSLAEQNSKNGLFEEAKSIYQDILGKFPKNKRAIDGIKDLSIKSIGKVSKTQEPPQEQLQHLIEFYNQGQLHLCLVATNQFLGDFPNSVFLHNIQGTVNARLQQFDAAIDSYQKAIKIKPDYADAYNNLGNVLRDKGDLEGAIESFQRAIKIKPTNADYYNNVGIAMREKGDLKGAIDSYQKIMRIKPDYADAYNNMGNAFRDQGNLKGAIDSYQKAIKIKPHYADAYNNLGNVLRDKGDLEGAINSYKQALKINPHKASALHMLDALTGNTTDHPPREYVTKLFDEHAREFDHILVNKLEYNIPKILGKIMTQQKFDSFDSVLDLGCGTGLMGVELKQYAKNIEGIDLSKFMIEQAEKKNIYNKISQFDLIEYLSTENLDFDLFVSTDVFIYVGELSEVFRLIKARNKRNGKLIFSTEHTEKKGFFLEKSGRYSHSKEYIMGLCEKFDYELLNFEKTKLRKEKNGFLLGGLYILKF